ncbi:ExbD/TolR family protein [Nitrosovibrio tenuis]|uniref:Biopolymer transport protein ExbD n=1 Tax=Nitrosovibrio tenuis TaxID=1233 RepID=A0A1H7KSV8_9PROT|nr:biopolymer transporter ExbD [Nitrosovibrio tenuis]SEK89644.1 biopolymer transport protein ExbD [Nitrosovibrio tenuis]
MNFQRGRQKEDPEINLVPMIDVLLVILIFLMITTTYSKFSELEINLPQAASDQPPERNNVIDVGITATGNYVINNTSIKLSSSQALSNALRTAAGDRPDPIIVIHADAQATHQSVIAVMEAARLAGYHHITFSTENPK